MKKTIILLFSLSLLILLTPAKGGSHDYTAYNAANTITPNNFPIYPPIG
jgi:hypothetical protein